MEGLLSQLTDLIIPAASLSVKSFFTLVAGAHNGKVDHTVDALWDRMIKCGTVWRHRRLRPAFPSCLPKHGGPVVTLFPWSFPDREADSRFEEVISEQVLG
jgi:hypothetical protein